MPFAMSDSIQAVVIGEDVYVGGGYSNFKSRGRTVMVYSIHTGLWRTLPPYMTWYFGMVAANNQLILVGGIDLSTNKATNFLGAWSKKWVHPFPRMSTPRHSPSLAFYKNWLVVAGGFGERGANSNKVELLNIRSRKWYESSPLPTVCSSMSSAINGNMWYLSRGCSSEGIANKRVFCVCLDDLISRAVLQSDDVLASQSTSIQSQPPPWLALADSPLTHSTVLVLNGALLTIGGYESSTVHLYQPSSKSWIKVGDLPTKLWECACTVFPSGKMFVAGGCSNSDLYSADNRIHIAILKD